MSDASQRRDPFKALADSTRRGILERLAKHDVCSAGEMADIFPHISRPAVSRHLRVLRHAGLVLAQGVGREHRYRLNVVALARVQRDWFAQFTPLMETSLAALKKQVELGDARDRRTIRTRTSARG